MSCPKCWDTALVEVSGNDGENLRPTFLCSESWRARNWQPLWSFPPQRTPHEKHPKWKPHSDLRGQCKLWKTARCGKTGCHGSFRSSGSSKNRVFLELTSNPLQDEFQAGKSTFFLWTLLKLGNCKFRSVDGKPIISGPNLAPWLD